MSMKKINCWEFELCGREEGGKNAEELGVCPAFSQTITDGMNGGKNGGRVCWAIAGTLCGGKTQGTFANKLDTCLNCDFYKSVQQQEGKAFIYAKEVILKMKEMNKNKGGGL